MKNNVNTKSGTKKQELTYKTFHRNILTAKRYKKPTAKPFKRKENKSILEIGFKRFKSFKRFQEFKNN